MHTLAGGVTPGDDPTRAAQIVETYAAAGATWWLEDISPYGRGLESFLGVYNFLDIVPKGRDESELPYSMSWVQRHDRYDR